MLLKLSDTSDTFAAINEDFIDIICASKIKIKVIQSVKL
jgi:hypothetical protein